MLKLNALGRRCGGHGLLLDFKADRFFKLPAHGSISDKAFNNPAQANYFPMAQYLIRLFTTLYIHTALSAALIQLLTVSKVVGFSLGRYYQVTVECSYEQLEPVIGEETCRLLRLGHRAVQSEGGAFSAKPNLPESTG